MILSSKMRASALAALLLTGLSGCVTTPNASVYSADRTMRANTFTLGRIVDVRTVQTQRMQNGQLAGAAAGAAVGALVGNQFGSGSGRDIMTAAGGLAGAYAGSNAANNANVQYSQEWFVRLDNGSNITVIQTDPTLAVGARVRVINDGRSVRLVR